MNINENKIYRFNYNKKLILQKMKYVKFNIPKF